MNKIKTHTNDRKKVTITDQDGNKRVIKGYTISNIPDEYTSWFNYKGLTYVTS